MSDSEAYENELMNSPIFEDGRDPNTGQVGFYPGRLSPTFHPMTEEQLAQLDSFEFGKGTPLEGVALAKPKASKPKKKLTVKLKKKKPAASSSKKKGGKRKSRRKRKKNTLKRTLKNIICGIQEVKDISQRHINNTEEVLN